MADKIVNLDDYREHYSFYDLEGNVHIVPCAFMEDVVSGKRSITELEGWEGIIPNIVDACLDYIHQED